MTKNSAHNRIEQNGYKITYCMNGAVIATKNQSIYTAKTINALYNIIFKTKY